MIKVFEPRLTLSDKLSVLKALQNNYISGTSPIIEEFENEIAEKFDRKYAVAVSNGSVALEVAFKSLNLPKGSEVVIPSFTIISCLSALLRADLKPIFCDVDKESSNVSLNDIKKVISPNTKALLMVHTYGLPCEAVEIYKFCKNNNIKVIEDAAEAHGIKVDGKPCGSFGDSSVFSFYANKHVTTGEGGAVLTDSEETYKLIKAMINLDFKDPERFNHENFYWNYRLSGLQAGLGISQLKNIHRVIKLKQNQGSVYSELFKKSEGLIQTPLEKIKNVNNNYWVYGLVLNEKISRKEVRAYLYNNKIETRDFFWPLHLQKAYIKSAEKKSNLPISENLGRQGFYIPLGKHINLNKQKYIVGKILEVVNKLS